MPGRYRAWPRIPFDLDQVFGEGRSCAACLGRAAQRLNRVESLIRAFRQRCECEKPAAWTRPAVRGATRSFPQAYGKYRRPCRRRRWAAHARPHHDRRIRCRTRRRPSTGHFECERNRAAWLKPMRDARPEPTSFTKVLEVDAEKAARSIPGKYGLERRAAVKGNVSGRPVPAMSAWRQVLATGSWRQFPDPRS